MPPKKFNKQKKTTTKSERSGLQFGVGRILSLLRKHKHGDRISSHAAVYLGAVLEYLAGQVLADAGRLAKTEKKMRITPRQLMLAMKEDEDLAKLSSNYVFPESGTASKI